MIDQKFQYLSVTELEDFQMNNLRQSLEYTFQHSPYYREQMAQTGFNAEAATIRELLEQLPFTTKLHLNKLNKQFYAAGPESIAEFVTTSGTLGSPVPVILTHNDLDRLAYNEAMGLSIAGVSSQDIVQITTTLDRRFMAGLAYYTGCRLLGSATIRTGIGLPGLQWDSVNSFKPTVLIGVPSFIVKMILYAREHNIDYRSSSVQKIVCIGEPLRYEDFTLNKTAQFITDHWDVQLFSTYASTEMATAFTECEAGCGGHEIPELIYTEVIDENGRLILDDTPGELVFTTFGIEGMPLVRYRSGDIVSKYTGICSCGRTTSRIGPVIGRLGQMLKYKGTTIFPAAFQHLLDQVTEIDTYYIEAVSNEYHEDEINVFIATQSDERLLFDKLSELFRGHLRVVPGIEFRPAAFINHIRHVPELRKPRIFIDNRQQPS